MSPALLRKVDGEGFESRVYKGAGGRDFFVADADIDSDGGKNVDGDRYWQADTTLHHDGKPIDALTVPGMVVPGWYPKAVKGIVFGCRGRVTNLNTMESVDCVVHDAGPLFKTGEITPAAARLISVNPNSVSGGEDEPCILYEVWPGMPAVVNGVTYKLQPA